MSIDVNYYSFSPSRADKQWPYFVEDISVLRKKHSTRHKHEKDSQNFQKIQAEIEVSFELRIRELRKKIFDFFGQKGYIIPWVEWGVEYGTDKFGNPVHMSDEDKMEYLESYGCVYPRCSDLKNKDVPYLMLRMDAPELEKSYVQIIKERDKAFSQLCEQVTVAPREDKSVELNKRQEELDKINPHYLKYGNTFDNNELLFDLKILDIYYGSVVNEYFENPKVEDYFLESLIAVYNLKTENDVPTREEWIRLFQNISNEKTQEVSERLANQLDWDKNEAECAIKDYLRFVRPVVKDLKENPDSIFFRFYGGAIEVEPKNVEVILLERAKKNAIKYKNQLPPIL